MTQINSAKHNLTYRPLTAKNIDALMAVEEACHIHPWSKKTFLSCIGGRYFGEQAELSANNSSSQLIGFYVAEFIIDEATLMDICVHPDQQGQGLGKLLLNQFIAQAKAKGAQKIWLEVRAKNISAQMLYMNAGFIETSRRTGYYPSNSGFGYEDAIVMLLTC